jgi:hypothetical protein
MTQEFDPLSLHIDQAQEVALKDDHTKTLEQVNSAEFELLKITQLLPPIKE